MARWKLITSHYLKIEGTFWEQIETDRTSGKQIRKRYETPLLLDTADQSLWNDNTLRNPRGELLDGDIVVAHRNSQHKESDYLFTGDPTADMLPLDDEAKIITAKLQTVWNASPNEEVPYARKRIDELEMEQAKINSKQSTVKVEGLEDILQGMKALIEQNSALMASLVTTKTDRRV
jgi:hypothetical protein